MCHYPASFADVVSARPLARGSSASWARAVPWSHDDSSLPRIAHGVAEAIRSPVAEVAQRFFRRRKFSWRGFQNHRDSRRAEKNDDDDADGRHDQSFREMPFVIAIAQKDGSAPTAEANAREKTHDAVERDHP